MDKVAIFGGTFNPIHNGHLHIARQYQRLLNVNKVLFVPTRVPPHKRVSNLAGAEERLAMCRMACREDRGFQVSDMEIRRESASYTSVTLLELSREYPGTDLFLLMGEDMFLTVQEWHEAHQIYSLCTLCAAPRSGNGLSVLRKHAAKLEREGAKVILHNIKYLPVSSTMIRRAVKNGKSLSGMAPQAVADYIAQNGLYRA